MQTPPHPTWCQGGLCHTNASAPYWEPRGTAPCKRLIPGAKGDCGKGEMQKPLVKACWGEGWACHPPKSHCSRAPCPTLPKVHNACAGKWVSAALAVGAACGMPGCITEGVRADQTNQLSIDVLQSLTNTDTRTHTHTQTFTYRCGCGAYSTGVCQVLLRQAHPAGSRTMLTRRTPPCSCCLIA
eukprot:1149058-Pelagomonas_calceolata.AAC.3